MKSRKLLKTLCAASAVTMAGMCAASAQAADSAPVLKVTFDQEDASDSSGKGNHGTVVGNPEYVEGISGKAIHLVNPDGIAGEYKEAEQYVNFGQPEDLKFGAEDFSILFWYKSDGADPEEVSVIGNKDWNSGGNQGISIADMRNGMMVNFTAEGASRMDTPRMTEATDNTWHHMAAVFDRSDKITLYMDGKKIADSTISSCQGKTIDVADFILGADGYKHFGVKDSYIDELEVYKYAFTADEILDMDAPYQLSAKIDAYEEILESSAASEEKKAAFRSELQAVRQEASKAPDSETVKSLLERLYAAYKAFSAPEKGLAEFEVLSDVHIKSNNLTETNGANWIDAMKDINQMFPDTLGVANCGDLADSGNEDQFEGYFKILEQYGGKIPAFLNALGNHDVRWKSGWEEIYTRYMKYNQEYMGDTDGKVYFDKWLGGYHFIVLNTEWDLKDRAYLSEEQLAWLDETLAENYEEDKPVFLFLHQALRDTYFNSNDWSVGVQDHQLKEILRKYPQAIMFTGHIHNGLGACTVLEKDFGTMVDVPSFYYNDGGGQSRGQVGYHVTVYEDRVLLSMYDYMNDTWLPEYSVTISTKPEDKKKSKVLEISFDDETANDISGNENHGTLAGSPEYVEGVKGKALHLVNDSAAKASQYVDFDTIEDLSLGTDDFSVRFWYKNNGGTSAESCLLSNKDWDSGANWGFAISAFPNGLTLNLAGEGNDRADTARFAKALDGNWHQITATFDRDGKMILYIDGKEAGSQDISVQAGSTIDVDGLNLVLGADGQHRYGVTDAYIDELCIYRTILGEGEIESLYTPCRVEPGVTGASFYWEEDANTEPAYLVLNGKKYKDISSGTYSTTIDGLKPDTEYTAMIVTHEKSHSGNYQDGYTLVFRTAIDPVTALQKELEEAKKEAEEAKKQLNEEKEASQAERLKLEAALKEAEAKNAEILAEMQRLERELTESRFTAQTAALKKVKSAGKKQAKVSWKKTAGADGYVIQYSLKANFKNKKQITVKDGNTSAKAIKKLRSGKRYYVRIRAYKISGGKKIYTKYSTKKAVVVK